MKKILLTLLFCLMASNCYGATYTAIAAGGNWNNVATWGGGGYPVAGDTANIDATMTGTVTINTNSACAVLNCTGNGGTLAFGNYTLTCTGNVTIGGTITAGTGGLTITGTSTMNSGGITFPGNITFSSSGKTITLTNNLVCSGSLIFPNVSITFSGAYDITCETLRIGGLGSARTISLVAGQTLTVTTTLWLSGDAWFDCTIKSATSETVTNLVYQGTVENCAVFGIFFTDINASGSAQGIDNWYGGTLTRTTNITNRTSADIGGGSSDGGLQIGDIVL